MRCSCDTEKLNVGRTIYVSSLFVILMSVCYLGKQSKTEVDTTHHLIKVDVPIPEHNCNMENKAELK